MSAARRKTSARTRTIAQPEPDVPPAIASGVGARSLVGPLGQGEGFARWLKMAVMQRLHHGVLVGGDRGTGKTHAVWHFAATLLCSDAGEGPMGVSGPCGMCRSCRQVATGNHADISLLDVPEGKSDIPLESVRNVLEELPLSSHGGRGRVLIIDPADHLNEQGQNALLKTLEEPAPRTWILMAASRAAALLPTVQSRVLTFQMRPLVEAVDFSRVCAEISPDLAGVDPDRMRRARGSVGAYLELTGETALRVDHLVSELVGGTNTLGPLALARSLLEGAEGRQGSVERVQLTLRLLGDCCRDAYAHVVAQGDSAPYGPGALEPWLTRSEALLAAETDLARQIPPEQVLTGALLDWRAAGG